MSERQNCYTCGRLVTSHGHGHMGLCPDHRLNRARMTTMSEKSFNKLIPVGSWAYDSKAFALREVAKRDHYMPRTEPF